MNDTQDQATEPSDGKLAFEIGRKEGWNAALLAATDVIGEMARARERKDVNVNKAISAILELGTDD